MGKLHQIHLNFVPVEDRLLLRISTTDQHEFRFWLTRRYVKLLWPALIDILRKRQPAAFKDAPSRSAALSLENQEAVKKADFETPYEPAESSPLGDTPILAARVVVKTLPGNSPAVAAADGGATSGTGNVLSILPESGPGVDIALDDRMIHSFCRLLAVITKKAGWDLGLDFGQAEELLKQRGLN